MIFADGRLMVEGGFHSSFIFSICLLRKVVGCVQFFPSNLIQNFKEREDKKVVGCVRKVVFFNFFFPSNLVQNFKEREERDSG